LSLHVLNKVLSTNPRVFFFNRWLMQMISILAGQNTISLWWKGAAAGVGSKDSKGVKSRKRRRKVVENSKISGRKHRLKLFFQRMCSVRTQGAQERRLIVSHVKVTETACQSAGALRGGRIF